MPVAGRHLAQISSLASPKSRSAVRIVLEPVDGSDAVAGLIAHRFVDRGDAGRFAVFTVNFDFLDKIIAG